MIGVKNGDAIKLSFRRSFGGCTAVSFCHEGKCDLYVLYEITDGGMRVVGETEDPVLRVPRMREDGTYLAEGYGFDHGRYDAVGAAGPDPVYEDFCYTLVGNLIRFPAIPKHCLKDF